MKAKPSLSPGFRNNIVQIHTLVSGYVWCLGVSGVSCLETQVSQSVFQCQPLRHRAFFGDAAFGLPVLRVPATVWEARTADVVRPGDDPAFRASGPASSSPLLVSPGVTSQQEK